MIDIKDFEFGRELKIHGRKTGGRFHYPRNENMWRDDDALTETYGDMLKVLGQDVDAYCNDRYVKNDFSTPEEEHKYYLNWMKLTACMIFADAQTSIFVQLREFAPDVAAFGAACDGGDRRVIEKAYNALCERAGLKKQNK